MGSSYGEMLKDPRWQRKRLEILERDGWKCQTQACGTTTVTLHVHHRRYERGLSPWEYDGNDLVTLCEDCHAEVTRSRRELEALMGRLSLHELGFLVGFAKSLLGGDPIGPFERKGHFVEQSADWKAATDACRSRRGGTAG
jgi:hypothetical protein